MLLNCADIIVKCHQVARIGNLGKVSGNPVWSAMESNIRWGHNFGKVF